LVVIVRSNLCLDGEDVQMAAAIRETQRTFGTALDQSRDPVWQNGGIDSSWKILRESSAPDRERKTGQELFS